MIYGYSRRVVNKHGLREMKEVTFHTTPDSLRRIGAFFSHAAARIEAGNAKTDHLHLSIEDAAWRREHPDVDVIVMAYQPVSRPTSKGTRKKRCIKKR